MWLGEAGVGNGPGIPTHDVPTWMRIRGREILYLAGSPRGKIQPYAKRRLELSGKILPEPLELRLFAVDGEVYLVANSDGRHSKERAIRRRRFVRPVKTLRKLRRSASARNQSLS